MTLTTHLSNACRVKNRHRGISLILLVSFANFVLGLFVITSVMVANEKHRITELEHNQHPKEKVIEQKLETQPVKKSSISIATIRSRSPRPRGTLLSSSNYYFRLDYSLVPSQCLPIEHFKSGSTVNSLETLTYAKFSEIISRNVSFNINVLRVNPILQKRETVPSSSNSEETTSICYYSLSIDTVFYVSVNCNSTCRDAEMARLVSGLKQINSSLWTFSLISNDKLKTEIEYRVQAISIYRISKYQESHVYIHSLFEDRYVSAMIIDSEGIQTSVIMSQRDKSLFKIETALDRTKAIEDPLSIYLSFSSLTSPNYYLRHYMSRIKLSKYEDTDIFRKDATFKLMEDNQPNVFIFEAINFPQLYISVDSETKAALVLTQLQSLSLGNLNQSFLFRFMLQN